MRDRLVETLSMQGQWFESSYPDAGYASPLGQGSDLLGIYQLTPTALLLRVLVCRRRPPGAGGPGWMPVVQLEAVRVRRGE